MTNQTPNPTHRAVKEHYGKYAREAGSCCGGATTAGKPKTLSTLRKYWKGYHPISPTSVPAVATPSAWRSYNPARPCWTLASGGGLDCFVAARQVGESGRVIGVDMTPEMLSTRQSQSSATEAEECRIP